jgi:electron transport complex protein RnfG
MTTKDIIKIVANLVVIYLIGGAILSYVHANTSPIRYENNIKAEEKALKLLIPDADKIEKMGDWEIHEKHGKYWKAEKNGKVIGYVILSFGKGYSSYIRTLIAVDKDFKIMKVEILDHKETPGLGDEIMSASWKSQFAGKDFDHIKLIKGETKEYIQAITGVTISSRAVTEDAVKNGVKFLIEKVKEGGAADVGTH